jgi:hypothetical protein
MGRTTKKTISEISSRPERVHRINSQPQVEDADEAMLISGVSKVKEIVRTQERIGDAVLQRQLDHVHTAMKIEKAYDYRIYPIEPTAKKNELGRNPLEWKPRMVPIHRKLRMMTSEAHEEKAGGHK